MSELLLHSDLTDKIIKSFYAVYNHLGFGFQEKVYENALALHLTMAGLKVVQQAPIEVYFLGQVVGEYFADIVVNELVIVELKAATIINVQHEAQLLNYLKATRYEVGLLLNFGPKPAFKRKASNNDGKGSMSWLKH